MTYTNNWSKAAEALDDILSAIVRKTAFDLQAAGQAQIRSNGQIDTGNMFNGVYVVTSQESTYKSGNDYLPSVEAPTDNQTAYVGYAASYSFFQNYGTSRIPARPFAEPAAEKVRPAFDAALAGVESALKGRIE